jgi:hypothetical protein
MNRLSAPLVVLACTASLGSAQTPGTNPYDYILSNFTGLFQNSIVRVDRTNGVATTLFPFTMGTLESIAMDADNLSYLVLDTVGTSFIRRVDLSGPSMTSVGPFDPSYDFVVDQDTSMVAATQLGDLKRITRQGAQSNVLLTNGFFRGLCIDLDTGDYIVNDLFANAVLRVTRAGVATTMRSGMIGLLDVAYDTGSGDFFVSRATGAVGFLHRLTRSGTLTTIFSSGSLAAEPRSLIVLPQGHPAGAGNLAVIDSLPIPVGVFIFTPMGALTSTVIFGQNNSIVPSGIESNNSRMLAPRIGTAAPTPGAMYQINIQATSLDFNRGYMLAASFTPRPGIPLPGGRTVPLVVDPLFIQSLVDPFLFPGFQGALDGNGRALAGVNIPNIAGLRGIRIFVAGIVIDAASPGGVRTVTNLLAFTIV